MFQDKVESGRQKDGGRRRVKKKNQKRNTRKGKLYTFNKTTMLRLKLFEYYKNKHKFKEKKTRNANGLGKTQDILHRRERRKYLLTRLRKRVYLKLQTLCHLRATRAICFQ